MRSIFFLICVTALTGCTSLFFQPHRTQYLEPGRIGLAYKDVYFPTTDGLVLHGWFLPAQGKARGTVLFLHGNAENISTHIANVYWLPARNYNVFLPDYRGYGLSQGTPSVPGVLDDITSAMTYLLDQPDVDPDRIVMLGQSLGGALAIYHAAHSPYRQKIKALIAESTFSDYAGIAREKLAAFWLTWIIQWPLSLTIDNAYSPLPAVGKVSPIPLLLIHGDQDGVIPARHSQVLFDAAQQPKELWLAPSGGHIEAFRHKAYQDRLVEYLERILPPKGIQPLP